MKKFAIIFAAALTVVMGCARESFAPANVTDEGEKVVLRATVAPQTRSAVSTTGEFSWQYGDTIAVKLAGTTGFTPFNLTDGAGTKVAEFTSLESGVTVEKVAVMPSDIAVSAGTDLTIHIPQNRVFEADRTFSPMVATFSGEDAGGLQFKHMSGLLAVTINHVPRGAGWFYVRSNSVKLYGDFTIKDYADEEDLIIPAGPLPSGRTNSSLWFAIPEELEGTGPVTFYAPLPVGDYPDLQFGILDEYTYYYEETKCVYENLHVDRGEMLTKTIDNIDWDIVYTRRGSDDGSDRVQIMGVPGTWAYIYFQYSEFTNHYGSSYEAAKNDLAAKVLSGERSLLEGNKNYRMGFVFPPEATFYVLVMQFDEAKEPTGAYLIRQWTPKQGTTSSDGFNKWIGKWTLVGETINNEPVTYTLDITSKNPDEVFQFTGWAGTTTKYWAEYDQTTGNMVILNHMLTYSSTQKSSSDGLEYKCRGGMFGIIGSSAQNTPLFTPIAICTIDESGSTAVMTGYKYYTDAAFETMCYYYRSYDKNANGKYNIWYTKKADILARFPINMFKEEIDD